MAFTPPDNSVIFRSPHWILNHHLEAKLSGYLILSPTSEASEFHELSMPALEEMGPIIARATQSIHTCFKPEHIFTSRYGVASGFSLHFHIIPVYSWIIDKLKKHHRYRWLDSLYNPDFGTTPDAADLTLFIWREFIEARPQFAEEGFSFEKTVLTLKNEMQKSTTHP